MTELKEHFLTAIKAAVAAGKEILEVYDSEFAVEHKEDRSPLTLADKKAHDCIVAALKEIGLPVLSEEGAEIAYEQRKDWPLFWMVDPLDGTKEFVKRNGEFTVNIALIEKGQPIAGVIYVPVKQTLYFGLAGTGAFKSEGVESIAAANLEELINSASQLPVSGERSVFKVVGSRSHMSEETTAYIEALKAEHGAVEMVSMGSSLKLCLVAEGVADVYPRFAPTMEWDTAAGQAILVAAGKEVVTYPEEVPMVYNRENLRNGWFLAR